MAEADLRLSDGLKLLVVDDLRTDFLLVDREIRLHGCPACCHWVNSEAELMQALDEAAWDAVLLDYNVPGMDFASTVSLLCRRSPDLPVIVVSSSIEEELVFDLLRLGAWDLVLKDKIFRLVPTLQRCLRESTARRALRVAEAELQASKERQLREQRNELDLLVRQQVAIQTAAALAHELNQPLVAISAYSEVALRMLQTGKPDPAKLTRALEGSVEQAQRAGRTVHELLDFLHKGETVFAAMDLNELVREAVAFAAMNGQGGFRPVLELDPDLPPVLGSRLQVQKVLINLLRNGVEAMEEAGVVAPALTVTVHANPDRTMAQVTVRDTGPGIGAEIAARLFEPFFTTKAQGIGLGLAISRSLIEAHGGQLWAASNEGPGATFHFTLPLAPA